MRIALISLLTDGAAEVRLVGQPLAWHQLQAALDLACERIVCLADAPGPDLALLQREAERRGSSFHAIAHHRALSGLVHAADTLIVFAPGVLPQREWLAQTFAGRTGIAVLPAVRAVELGFERIDRDRAWAGVLATRGDAVEALGELPPDGDPVSGLLRVALQRGAQPMSVPENWLDDDRWALVASQPAAERFQNAWYARHAPSPRLDRPGQALAHRLARAVLDRSAHGTGSAAAAMAGGTLLAIAGAAAGYLGHIAPGLAALTGGALLLATGTALLRHVRSGSGERVRAWPGELRDALLDLSLVAIAASPTEFAGWSAAFPVLVLLGVVRLSVEGTAPAPLRPFGDRPLVFGALAVGAAADLFDTVAGALALAGLALRLFWPRTRG